MKILIKYATRQRPQYFMRAIANIYATISDSANMEIFVSIDIDDFTMNNQRIFDFMKAHEQISWAVGKSESKIDAINRDMDNVGEWDIVVVMSDDMCFVVHGWDNIIRQRMVDHFPDLDGFLHFNDGYVKDALATMSILGKKYYDRDGYIYHPSYKSFSCDAEAFFVAKTREKHQYFDQILATHQHPSNAKIPNDDLYHKNSLHTPADTKNYWDRLHNDFGMKEEGYSPPFAWDKYKTR